MTVVKFPVKKKKVNRREEEEPRPCELMQCHFQAMRFNGHNQEAIKNWIDGLCEGKWPLLIDDEGKYFMMLENPDTGTRLFIMVGDYLLFSDSVFHVWPFKYFNEYIKWR